jgi:hypothetical protein
MRRKMARLNVEAVEDVPYDMVLLLKPEVQTIEERKAAEQGNGRKIG